MAKIHELIPVEADKIAAATAAIDGAVVTFTKQVDQLMGVRRKVELYAEDRQQENTTEIKEVVTTVSAKLDDVWGVLADAVDVSIAKENSNTSQDARADVRVGTTTVLSDVPATALLALEKRIAQIKSVYAAIPTLDPSFNWEADEGAALPNVMRTTHSQEAQKTEKTSEFKVVYEATKEHPAQIVQVNMDKNVAKVTTDRQSGAVSPATKAMWLRRIGELATAVKEARQRANMADVLPLPVADDIRAFIHG